MEAHPYSVKRYLPAVRHNVKLAKKYERLAINSKGNKRRRYTRKGKQYRHRAKAIASRWTAQVRWNRDNWEYVMNRKYGLPDPEVVARLLWGSKTEEDAHKARSYDFWENTDVHVKVETDSQHGTSEIDHPDG